MHLHIPDGVLPLLAWGPGLALALLLLAISARATRRDRGLGPGYQGALAALMLAAMAVEIPLGPLEYHLTLIGPVGALLGPAAAFQAVFVANLILAFIGHGGFTVVGLNALVLGAGAALSRPIYRRLRARFKEGACLAAATAVAQAVSGVLWIAVVGGALGHEAAGDAATRARLGVMAALAFPMALLGIAVESAVAYGTARFITRVRPDLLPAGPGPKPEGEA